MNMKNKTNLLRIGKHRRKVRKHSRRFYLGLVITLIVGFILFSIFINMFSKTSKTVYIPWHFLL